MRRATSPCSHGASAACPMRRVICARAAACTGREQKKTQAATERSLIEKCRGLSARQKSPIRRVFIRPAGLVRFAEGPAPRKFRRAEIFRRMPSGGDVYPAGSPPGFRYRCGFFKWLARGGGEARSIPRADSPRISARPGAAGRSIFAKGKTRRKSEFRLQMEFRECK